MQQEQDRGFSLSALGLGLVTASLAECFYSSAGAYGARSILLLGFLNTAGLAAAAGLFAALAEKFDLFSGQGFLPKLAGWGFFAWFALETGRTIAAAQIVCREHFGSNALIAVLPVLLLVSWQMNGSALDRSARAIWWLLAAGILACLAGLWDQMHWHRLFGAEDPSLWADGWPKILLYPEYFALPLLCQGKRCAAAPCCRSGVMPYRPAMLLCWNWCWGRLPGRTIPVWSCCGPGRWGIFPVWMRCCCCCGWRRLCGGFVCWLLCCARFGSATAEWKRMPASGIKTREHKREKEK